MTTLVGFVGPVPGTFNMLPWGASATSSNFSDSAFVKTRSSVSSGVSDPSGGTSAFHLTEDSSNDTHLITTNNLPVLATATSTTYRAAAIAKADQRTRMVMQWGNPVQDANSVVSVGFDLTGGNCAYDIVTGSNSTFVASTMTSLGGGYWLCTLDMKYNGTHTGDWPATVFLDNGSGTAARSISYAGNGTSGIDLWWLNVLPLAAWSVNNLAFYDDFADLSTIDLSNTKAPGFNWYINNHFENCPLPNYAWITNPPSDASSFTQPSASIVEIYNPNNNQAYKFTSLMMTVVTDGAGGLIGQSFKAPMVWDGYFNWNGTTAFHSANWGQLSPAFWTQPNELLTNTIGSPNDFIEWDVVEGAPIVPGDLGGSTTVHETYWGDPSNPSDLREGFGNSFSMAPGTYMRISGMWFPIDSNGGTYGLFQQYVNGQMQTSGDLSYTVSAPFNVTRWENFSYPIILNTANNITSNAGGGWPMFIDWIKIYTSMPIVAPRSKSRISLGIGLGLTMH